MPKSNVPKSRLRAAAIAREAWSIKPEQVAVRGSLRIPAELESKFNEQDSTERGSVWTSGVQIEQRSLLLYQVIETLSGHGVSLIIDNQTTLIVGQNSFKGASLLEALLNAIAFYLPPNPEPFDLESHLEELDLLE